jgi:hypothetical protein
MKYPWRQLRICSFLELLVMVRLDPFPTFAMAMMVELGELTWKVDFADSPFSGMLHIA